MKAAKEILKYKCNSMNHLIHFPVKGNSQLEGIYIHVSTVYEAMEEYVNQKKEISFDTEYALQGFRETQEQYFDEEGKAYRVGFGFEAERMLKLINLLESDLKK